MTRNTKGQFVKPVKAAPVVRGTIDARQHMNITTGSKSRKKAGECITIYSMGA